MTAVKLTQPELSKLTFFQKLAKVTFDRIICGVARGWLWSTGSTLVCARREHVRACQSRVLSKVGAYRNCQALGKSWTNCNDVWTAFSFGDKRRWARSPRWHYWPSRWPTWCKFTNKFKQLTEPRCCARCVHGTTGVRPVLLAALDL